MFEKNIKKLVNKQLKKKFPNWQRLQKKEKKEIASDAPPAKREASGGPLKGGYSREESPAGAVYVI